MFLLFFSYLSQLLLQVIRWRCYTFYTFIYSNNCCSNVKIGQYWQKIQANLACFEEILLFLQWHSNLCFNLGLLNIDKQTANAELKAEKSNNFLGNKRAMGGKRVKTYRRRLLDALFKTYRILQIQNPVLNVATVDVPGVIISIPWRPCKHILCLLGTMQCAI